MTGLVTDLARKPTDLSRSLRVIGAGMSRTGTSSFTMALEILLQGPVMHSGSSCMMREEEFIKDWISICGQPAPDSPEGREYNKKTLRKLMAGYLAVTDSPAVNFTEELVELYPDAIVICTTRDPERWWRSFKPVAETVWMIDGIGWVLAPLPTVRYFSTWVASMTKRSEFLFGKGNIGGPEHLDKHEAYVRRVTPPERLFFFDVKSGWEPLCKILDVPVPDEPFPFANDAQEVQAIFQGFIKAALLRWLMMFTTVGVVGWAAWWGMRG